MNSLSSRLLRNPLAALFLLTAFTLAAYHNTFQAPFTFDDFAHITDNPFIRIDTPSPAQLARAATESPMSRRWLPYVSFALDYMAAGYSPWIYHLTNLVIHLAAAVVLYFLALTTLTLPLFRNRCRYPREIALTATLIWALHPVQTNAVTYIVQRMTSMATLFFLLALLAYVRGRLRPAPLKRLLWFAVAGSAGILALASKENAAMLPFMVLAYEFFFLRPDGGWGKNRRFTLAILAATLLLAGAITLLYLGGSPMDAVLSGYRQRDFTPGERLLTEARVICHYLTLLLWPAPSRLNLAYDFPVSHSLLTPFQTLFAVTAVLFICLLPVILFRRQRLAAFAALWFPANLAIESTIIPLELAFEHRLYLPTVFPALAAALLLFRLRPLPNFSPRLVAGGLFVLLALLTWQRNTVWRSEVSLWSDVIAKSPGLARGYGNLAKARGEKGNHRLAETLFRKAMKMAPADGRAYLGLGAALLQQDKPAAALKPLRQAASLANTDQGEVYSKLAYAHYKLGDYQTALNQADLALEKNPYLADAHATIGAVYYRTGRFRDAEQRFRRALDLEPGNGRFGIWLGSVLERQNRLQEALSVLRAALEKPRTDLPLAYNNLGIVYWRLRRFQESVRAAEKALALNPDYADAYITLGITLEDTGRQQQAFQQFRKAWLLGYDMVSLYLNWTDRYLEQGNRKRALLYLRAARRLEPDNPEIRRRLPPMQRSDAPARNPP